MGPFVFSFLLISLGIFFVPVYLLRRQAFLRTQDFVVAARPTPPDVIRNSSTAYALKLIIFALFFGWGVSGEFWPAFIGAICYGLGWGLILLLRQPIIDFMDSALRNDQSITIHQFITLQHGNDPRVRLLSSSLTLFALLAVLIAETTAVAALLQPLQWAGTASVDLAIAGVLVLMALYAAASGNSAVMRSVQLQFGMMFLGLLGTGVLLLYLHVSELTPLPPHGLFAILIAAGCCVFILFYRRSKYIDTSPLLASDDRGDENSRESLTARLLKRFAKVVNPSISVFASLIIVLAGMGLYFAGPPAIARSSIAALQAATQIPGAGLIALILLPLIYPIADVTNWQRIAVAAKSNSSDNIASRISPEAWRRIFAAVEAPVLWLFTWALGALAAVAAEPTGGLGGLPRLVEQLGVEQNDITAIALALLLLCVFAMALAAMTSIFSACLCTIRYDILPGAERRIGFAPILLVIIPIAALILSDWSASVASTAWALAVLYGGIGSTAGAVAVYLMTEHEAWLWTAAPASLASALLVFVLGRLLRHTTS
jgi:hypothetical protein